MQFLNFFQLTMFWTIAYTFFSCVSLSTFVTWAYLVATSQEGLFWSSTSCWQRRRYNYSNTKVERPLQRPLRPSNSLDIEKLKEEKSESHICESQTIERILYEKCLGIDIDLCILAKIKILAHLISLLVTSEYVYNIFFTVCIFQSKTTRETTHIKVVLMWENSIRHDFTGFPSKI